MLQYIPIHVHFRLGWLRLLFKRTAVFRTIKFLLIDYDLLLLYIVRLVRNLDEFTNRSTGLEQLWELPSIIETFHFSELLVECIHSSQMASRLSIVCWHPVHPNATLPQ
jgi:hypothetical protein